jgi:DNA-binding GntR family transcriptional regulator
MSQPPENTYTWYSPDVPTRSPSHSRQRDAWPTRAAEAYYKLRKLIYSGELDSSSLLVEAELVRELGMSRTPIRDALHRLEVEGLLTSVPRGGYAIVEFDEKDLRDLYLIRACLEGLAAATAATVLTRVDLARLQDLYDNMSTAVEAGDDDQLTVLNREFHQAIAGASGNTHLMQMLDDIKSVFERFRTQAVADAERRVQAHQEHGSLIEALGHKDSERARELAEQHVRNALERGIHVARSVDGRPVAD